MAETDASKIARPHIDDTVPQAGNHDGDAGHYSGQEAGSFDSPSPDRVHSGAFRGGMAAGAPTPDHPGDIPADTGHRATIDQRTGEVRGSGAGAGGGTGTEDYDVGTPGGGE